jgi:hypothetical protein
MRHRGTARIATPWLLTLLAAALLPGVAAAASDAGRYAYLYVQGRLSNPSSKTAMEGARIRLTSGETTFETTTDSRGSFVFEKLPLGTYLLHVTTADGRVMDSMQEIGLSLTGPKRYKTRFSTGPEAIPAIVVKEKEVTVKVPKPTVKWKRFWTQFAIFAGGALILAL